MNDSKSLLHALIAAAWLATPLAVAQTKDLEVVPAHPDARVQLDIRINQHTVAIGDEVVQSTDNGDRADIINFDEFSFRIKFISIFKFS